MSETKKIEKPISLTIEEFKREMADLINNSQLPPVVLDLVIKDIYNEVHAVYTQQTVKEQQEYDASTNEENETKPQIIEEQGE